MTNYRRVMEGLRRIVGPIDDYLAIDVKTTGLLPHEDLITQIGLCRVVNRQIQPPVCLSLNWPETFSADEQRSNWLAAKLASLEAALATRGESSSATWESLRAGLDPPQALSLCLGEILDASSRLVPVIAHNGYRFDSMFLDRAFAEDLGVAYSPFSEDVLVDTGALVLASRINEGPGPCDNLESFYRRVFSVVVGGVSWSLRNFAEACGESLPFCRDAAEDARMCAVCFEHFKRLGGF